MQTSETYMIGWRARLHQQRDSALSVTCHTKRGNSGTRRSPGRSSGVARGRLGASTLAAAHRPRRRHAAARPLTDGPLPQRDRSLRLEFSTPRPFRLRSSGLLTACCIFPGQLSERADSGVPCSTDRAVLRIPTSRNLQGSRTLPSGHIEYRDFFSRNPDTSTARPKSCTL
jgi:hypothetical protein